MGITESRFIIMAILRSQQQSSYSVGLTPPTVTWTVVRGDTAAFRVYVTDDNKDPLVIEDWTIAMEIKRPNTKPGEFTDDAELIVELTPSPTITDLDGEFTVSLSANDSTMLETGDIFDIELSDESRVWTVARGTMIIIEDVTNSES
jgi:hypothetical protein